MYYYQFNIGDYQSHTAHLEPLEDLAYRRLLDWCYLHERPLPDDIDHISKLIRMRSHSDCIAVVLREFFVCTPEGWWKERISKEIERTGEKSRKASESAKVRWQKEKFDANALPTQSERNATHNPLPITQNTVEKRQRGSRLPTDFLFPKEWADFCVQQRPDLNLQNTFDSFKDFWIAKAVAGGAKLDWFATWRNWVRNQSAPKTLATYSQVKADVARITVPENRDYEATQRRVEAEALVKRNGPSEAVLERLKAIRNSAEQSQ